LIEIINKPLLLHLVGYLYYLQMEFNSVFKGLIKLETTLFYFLQISITPLHASCRSQNSLRTFL